VSTDSTKKTHVRAPWETQTFSYNTFHLRLQKCLREATAAAPRSILELGCGVGVLRQRLLEQMPDVDYYGCDVSHSAVEQLADPQVVQCDLNLDPIPFYPSKFDCVVGSGILEYIAALPDFLVAVRERLTPGRESWSAATSICATSIAGICWHAVNNPAFIPTGKISCPSRRSCGCCATAGFATSSASP